MSYERLREAQCSQPQHLSWTLSTNASKKLWLDQKVHNVLKTQQGVSCSVKVRGAFCDQQVNCYKPHRWESVYENNTFSHSLCLD